MDFVADQLVNGQRFGILTIVDVYTREALCTHVGHTTKAETVVEICNRLTVQRGAPCRAFVDKGSEFSARIFDLWAYHNKAQIEFSRRGKPTGNRFIETFKGSLRDKCLTVHWFESLYEAKTRIDAWRAEYNESRHHQGLKGMTPAEYAVK